MNLSNWIMIYVANLCFWLWIVKWGGAEKLGDTPLSGIFTFCITLKWNEMTSGGIKLLMSVIFFIHTIFFILGILVPEFRTMLG